MSTKPRIFYFDIRARAEPAMLALAAAGVDFDFEPVTDPSQLKQDLDHYHFGQVPRYVDEGVDICQSLAILRHIGRKYKLYGAGLEEQATVDEVIDGAHDLGTQFFSKVFGKPQEEREEAKEAFWQAHLDPASTTSTTARGAHAGFLSRLLKKSSSGFFVPSGLTVADILVTQIFEMLKQQFDERLAQQWPDLAALHDRVLAQPGIVAYVQSEKRPPPLMPPKKA